MRRRTEGRCTVSSMRTRTSYPRRHRQRSCGSVRVKACGSGSTGWRPMRSAGRDDTARPTIARSPHRGRQELAVGGGAAEQGQVRSQPERLRTGGRRPIRRQPGPGTGVRGPKRTGRCGCGRERRGRSAAPPFRIDEWLKLGDAAEAFAQRTWTALAPPGGLPVRHITAMGWDQEGCLWVAVGNGLRRFDCRCGA